MALLTIPTFDSTFYTQTTVLESVSYLFYFAYNQREDTWSFSISDSSGNLLVDGVKIVCNISLIAQYQYITGLPPGLLFCLTTTTDDSPPGLEDLVSGGRCLLQYLESTTPAGFLASP